MLFSADEMFALPELLLVSNRRSTRRSRRAAFVLSCFQETMGTGDSITVLADGDGSWARAAGLAVNLGKFGGVRCARASFVVTNGVVVKSYLEVRIENRFRETV